MAKIKPKQTKQTETPSGQFDAPIEVALTGSMLGGSVTDFETLIVRTISQVVYGDVASTAKSINDIKGFAKKNQNPFDVAENTLKKIESLEKIHKQTNEILKPIAAGVVKLAMFTGGLFGMAGSNTGFLVSPVKQPQMPGSEGKGNAQQVKIAIDSNNLDEVLEQLSNLSDDGTLSTLADVFEIMVDNAKGLKEVEQYMTPFTDSIIKLTEQNKNITEFTSVIEPFIKGLDSMSKIKPIDTDSLELIGYTLEQLSSINFDEANVENVLNTTKKIINELSNIDTSSIDIKQFDLLKDVGDKFKILENIQNVELNNLEDLILNIPRINNVVDEISKIENIKKGSLKNFNEFIKWIGTLEFNSSGNIPKEFIQQLKMLNGTIIPKTKEIIENFKGLTIRQTFPKRLETLKLVLEKINSIDLDTSKSKLKITKSFAENINALSESGPAIEKLADNTKNLKNVKLEDIEHISKIISRLSDIEFNSSGKIDIDALQNILDALPNVNSLINEFDKNFVKANYKELLATTSQIKTLLANLEETHFSGNSYVNYVKLEELTNEVFPKISPLIDKIKGVNVDKTVFPKIESIVEILDKVDWLEFKGKRNINLQKLEEVDNSLPTIITVCRKINEASIENGAKTVNNIAKTLNAIGEINTADFEDKDFTKVVNTITVLMSITNTVAGYDSKANGKIDLLKAFIDEFIEDDDSPLRKLSTSSVITDFNKKEKDIKKLVDTTKTLTDSIKAVAALGAIGAMVIAGVKVMKTYITSLEDIIKNIDSLDSKKVEAAMGTMKGMVMLIAVSTVCMLIGGFFVVKMPQLVIGALAFGLVLSTFIFTVLLGINYATKGIDTAKANLKDIAILIIASTFVMMIGAAFMLINPKLFIAALGFSLALATFIFATIFAINIGTRGLEKCAINLKDFAVLLMASAFIMMIGAAIVLYKPEILLGAIGFTVALAGFLFATLKAITLGTKGVEKALIDMRSFAILLAVSAMVMIIGGFLTLYKPMILVGAIGFTVALGLFLFATLKAVTLGTKGIEIALEKAKAALLLVGVSAAIMILGGELFILQPQLMLTIPVFIAMQTLMFGSLIFICKMLNKADKEIIKAQPILTALAIIVGIASAAMVAVGASVTIAGGFGNLMLGVLAMDLTLVGIAMIAWGLGYVAIDPMFSIGMASLASLSIITLIASVSVGAVGLIASKFDLMTLIMGVANIGLVMGGIALIATIVGTISLIPTFWSGLVALGMMTGITMAASLTVPAVGILCGLFDLSQLLIGVTNIGIVMGGIALIAVTVGTIALIPTFWTGLFAMTALTGITTAISLTVPIVGLVCGLFDLSLLLKGVANIGLVMGGIAMIASAVGLISLNPFFWIGIPVLAVLTTIAMYASLAMLAIGGAMKMMKSVGKIDTKLIVQNVKAFISIAKELEPIGFVAPIIIMASAACTSMAKMIDKLSKTVKDVANLRVDVYEGTKVVGKRELTKEDFSNAAKNVGLLITTLGTAVINVYQKNPQMFRKGADGPFAQTVYACTTMSKMISKIAEAVKDYADMKIAIDWDKDGKAKAYRNLGKADFELASQNIGLIVTTLSKTIISIYQKNPEMFEDGDKSIFAKTTKTLRGLGKLIGDIGGAIGDIAALQIPIDWNKDGKAIKYRTLGQQDFDLAKDNISAVISTIGEGIMSMYESHTEWFEETGGSLFSSGKSPFSKVLKVSQGLAKLIGSVGESVGDIAALQIPIDWNKDGKAIKYRTLGQQDFNLAKDNIGVVISTIGEGIMSMYDKKPEWFEEGGNFLMKTASPFTKVLKVSQGLAKLIGNVGESVGKIAALQIPIDWNKDGKAIKYRTLGKQDFDLAKDNIGIVISTIGKGIMKMYDEKPEWFAEGGNLLMKTSSPFTKVLKVSQGLSKLIASVGSSVANMASLRIPIDWDKNGKPIDFRSIGKQDFDLAKDNIGVVISTIGKGIMEIYEKEPTWFDEGFLSVSSSPFTRVLKGTNALTDIIAKVSESISKMAALQIPTHWTKEGKPDEFRNLQESDFTLAKDNIGTVITTIATGLIEMYDQHPDWFDEGFLGLGDSPFAKVMNGSIAVTEIISNVSEGIANMASLSIPTKWNEEGKPIEFRQMGEQDFNLAKENIHTVIKTIAESLMNMYDQHPDWFDEGFLGLGDSPFAKVMNGSAAVAGVIANISEGIINLASMNIPTEWDEKTGKPIKFRQMQATDFSLAKDNIATVVTTVATGLMDMYDDHEEWFDEGFLGLGDSPFAKVMNSSVAVGQLIANISEGIVNLAALQIPDAWSAEGKPIHFRQLNNRDFALAKNNIAEVVTTIANGLLNLVDKDGDSFLFGYRLKQIISSTTKIGELISNIATGVANMASMRVTEEWDEKGKPKKYRTLNSADFVNATINVSLIVTTLGNALAEAAKKMSTVNFLDIFKVTTAIDEAIKVIGSHAFFLSLLGTGNYVYYDTRYKKERKIPISEEGMASAAKMISSILQYVSEGISIGASYGEGLNFADISKMLLGVEEAINTMAGTAKFMGNLGNGKYVYRDVFDGFKEKTIDNISIESSKRAGEIVKVIITSVADAISQATDKLNSDGFTLFGKSDDDKIGLTFKALNKATSMLGRLAKVVSYYANGEIAETTIGADGTISIQRSGAPDVETAKKNMSTIITGLADIIKSTSEKIDEIDNVDETISGLHKSLRVVDASIYAVNEITKAKTNIDALQGFSFSNIMTPVLSDIDKVFAQMNSVGKNDKSGGFFGRLLGVENQSPLNQFINDANRMVMQSLLIASSPLEESYNKLRNVITSTTETMENFHLPENFGQQTESLDKFIKSVNTIKVDGVDSLTALLRELNKLGINMGNMDKLTTAISNKLSITLMNMKKSMDALNKTMIEDGKRKKKHTEEIRKSVTEIQKLMSQTMQVNVKMEDSGSSSIGESENDTNKGSTTNDKDVNNP